MSQRRLLDEPWRAVCPNGHNSWCSRVDGGYVCEHCGRFETLHDAAEIARDPNPMYR